MLALPGSGLFVRRQAKVGGNLVGDGVRQERGVVDAQGGFEWHAGEQVHLAGQVHGCLGIDQLVQRLP